MTTGGYRAPNKPAAVSGPGRFSARTDSGRAQMAAAGGDYGSRQQMESQQSSADVPVGNTAQAPAVQGAAGSQSPMGAGGLGFADVFRPTDRPGEPATAGMMGVGGAQVEPDVDYILRKIYQRYPSPWIASLMNGQ